MIVNIFLGELLKQKGEGHETYKWYLQFLQSFGATIDADLTVDAFRPFHVSTWYRARDGWSDSTKNCAVRAVKRCFAWAEEEGYIDHSPIAKMTAPAKTSRETVISAGEFQQLLALTKDQNFRDLLNVLWHTGCRPQEAFAIEAKHFEAVLRRVVFPPSKAKGKKFPRAIYLNDVALEIVARLCEKHPEGPILRNVDGVRWNAIAVASRFSRLKPKVGRKYCAYEIRHTFATDGLKKGMDSVNLSVLMGHSDASTLARVYQHLAKDPQFMAQQAERARGSN